MNTESEIPVTGLYADEAPSGYIEPPTNTQFHAGVEPEMTLPAAWWNYFVNLFTNTNIKAKEDITAILAELNNALTGGGVTPDPEAANQLLTLLRKGSGSTVNADKVRATTPGARGLQYLAAAAVSNIATLILADLKTVDGSGSGLDADLLDGQHGSYYAPKANPVFTGGAHIANTFIASGVSVGEQGGFLIITDIPPTENIMTHLEFTMNAYGDRYPCIGIVQCYSNGSTSAITQSRYSAIGSAPPYCRIFFTDNALCFWIPKTFNYQTLHPVLHTNYGPYKIVSTTAAALPASRDREVTANVLLPWSSINDGSGSGLDADLLDGQHGSYYAKVNTATSSDATNLPVGTYIMASGSKDLSLNSSVEVYITTGGIYGLSQLEGSIKVSGTWRLCGSTVPSGYVYLVRRVA